MNEVLGLAQFVSRSAAEQLFIYLFIYLFTYLLEAYNPVNPTGSPQHFSLNHILHKLKPIQNMHIFRNVKHNIIRKLVPSVLHRDLKQSINQSINCTELGFDEGSYECSAWDWQFVWDLVAEQSWALMKAEL